MTYSRSAGNVTSIVGQGQNCVKAQLSSKGYEVDWASKAEIKASADVEALNNVRPHCEIYCTTTHFARNRWLYEQG